VEGTLPQHEPGLAEHGRTPAQDERSGKHPEQAATSARGGKQELAHGLGQPAEAWLASISHPARVVVRFVTTPTGGWPQSCTSRKPTPTRIDKGSLESPPKTRRRGLRAEQWILGHRTKQ
jgi:hypothetical protein